MKADIKKNYILNLIYQFLLVIAPLITTPYISKTLGAEGIGIYSFSYSVVNYFVLIATLGTSWYGQREIAYSQGDKEQLSRVFWNVVLFRILSTVILSTIYIFYVINFSKNFSVSLIQILYLITVAFDITWLFQGLEEFDKIVKRNITIKLLSIICIFLFVKDEKDLLNYVLNLAFFPLLGNIVLWSQVKKQVGLIRIELSNLKKVLIDSFKLFVPNIAIQIYTVLDKTMIGLFTKSSFENGYYEQSEKIVKVSLMILTSLGTVIAPRIANAYKNNRVKELKQYIYKSFHFVWLIGLPLTAGLTICASLFVPWFLGEEFQKCIVLIKIFSGLVLAIGINNVSGVQYLIPTGKQNILTISVICGAVVNCVLNLLLIPRIYSIGAAISSVIAESIVSLIQVIYLTKFCEFSIKDILKTFIKCFVSTIIMSLALIYVKQYMKPNITCTIIFIFIGLFIYCVTIFALKDKLLIEFANEAKKKFNNNNLK